MTLPVDLPRPPRRLRALAAALALAATLGVAPAPAQEGQGATYTFLIAAAEAGERCELIEPWEAATIRAEARRLLIALGTELRAELLAAATERAAATRCSDTRMNVWLDGTRPGVLREWLPPYLALFRAFAKMTSPPLPFLAATRFADRANGQGDIDAYFAELAAAGVQPEGAANWATFIQQIESTAEGLIAGLLSVNINFSPDDAAAYMVDAGIIGTLWLARAR